MGGMQALQWAVSHPRFMRGVVALTPMARTAPWARAINAAVEGLVRRDPEQYLWSYNRYKRPAGAPPAPDGQDVPPAPDAPQALPGASG
jgi:homoserine acetyltransferase